MAPRLSRRSYVAAAALSFTTALAGCRTGSASIGGSWPMRGYDTGYTYYNAAADRVDSAPTLAWRESFSAAEGSVSLLPPLVGRGQVYTTAQRETSPDANPDRTLHAVGGGGRTNWQFASLNTLQNGTIRDDVAVFSHPPTDGVVGVDTADGSETWRFVPDGGTTTRPRVRDDTAFATTADGSWVALDVTDGTVTNRFPVDVDGGVYDRFAVADGSIVAHSGTDGRVLRSIDARSGTEDWRASLGEDAAVGPTVVDDSVLARIDGADEGEVVCFERDDGTERWRYAFDDPIGPRIVTDGERAFVSVETSDAVRVSALTLADGSLAWDGQRTYRDVRSPVGAGDAVIFHDGSSLFAVDLTDGRQLWDQSIESVERIRDLVVSESTVYLTADHESNGVLVALS